MNDDRVWGFSFFFFTRPASRLSIALYPLTSLLSRLTLLNLFLFYIINIVHFFVNFKPKNEQLNPSHRKVTKRAWGVKTDWEADIAKRDSR